MTTITTTAGVFESTLGNRWHELDDAIRRLHRPDAVVTAGGAFRIRHGTNFVTRTVAWLAGMPAAGETVDMRLVVTPSATGEEWRRTFAGRIMSSTQQKHADAVVAERVGMQEIHLSLHVEGGSLHYRSQRVTLCLGRLRLPLPGFLTPRVTASEQAVGARVAVCVEARLPLVGLLIAYDGVIEIDEA